MFDARERLQILNTIEPYCEEYNLDLRTVPIEWFYSLDDLRNYNFVFHFETQMNRARFFINAHTVWLFSIFVSAVYVLLVFGGQQIMSQRKKPFELRLPLIFWNVGMSIFSCLGFVRVSHELFRVLDTHGFVYSVCASTYGRDPVAAFWISTFVCSKFVELIDTAFIVLRKRPLQFLHWYHHVTVLIFAWHSAKSISAAGRWWAWMNYGVHAFMYAYYALRAMKFRVPRWFQIFVTTLQLAQMMMGVLISYTVFRAKFDWKITCQQSTSNLFFSVAIYVSYFLLFAKYFYNAYVSPIFGKAFKMEKIQNGQAVKKTN